MKKYVLLVLLIIFAGCGSATKGLIAPEFTALKAQGDVQAVKMQAQEVSALKGNLDANSQMALGTGNEITKQSAGRDLANTNTNTNDTKLMMYVVKGLVGLCTTLIGILGWCLKTLIKRGKEKDFYKKSYFLKSDPKESLEHIKDLHDKYVKGGKLK